MNQEEFFIANQVDGQLSDAQTMQMLVLPEGDSSKEQVSEPAAEAPPEPEAKVETVEEAKPVILAKDGVHTIEYEKLVEAREAEQHWKRVALEAQQLLEAQKAAAAQAPQAVETLPAEDGSLLGDFSEEAIAKGVEKLVAQKAAAIQAEFDSKLSTVLAPLQAKQAEAAADDHFNAIAKVHPDVESIAKSESFEKWIDAQPSFVRDGYKQVVAQGTAEQVIETLNAYKAANGNQTAPAQASAAAAAQAVIAKAQAAPPMSLSDIPAGSSATTDERAAMLEMSGTGLMNKFDGKSPEQIMALMNRVL